MKRTLTANLVAASPALSVCGSDDDDGGTAEITPSSDQAEHVVSGVNRGTCTNDVISLLKPITTR